MKKLWIAIVFFFVTNAAFAQFDKSLCEELLSKFTKANENFVALHVATFDKVVNGFYVKEDKDFNIEFKDKFLVINCDGGREKEQVYFFYKDIVKIDVLENLFVNKGFVVTIYIRD